MPPTLAHLLVWTRRRMRLQWLLQGSVFGSILAAFSAAVAVYAFKLAALSATQLLFALAAALIVGVAVVALFALRPISDRLLARLIDQRYVLDDRISSTLEFQSMSRATPFMRAHIAETMSHLPSLSAGDVCPLRRPRALWLALAQLACLGLVSLLQLRPPPALASASIVRPGPRQPLAVDPAELASHRLAAQRLRATLDEHSPAELKDVAKALDRFVEQLHAGGLTREEAFSRVARLQDKLAGGLRAPWRDLEQRLRQLGQRLQRRRSTKDLGDALRSSALASAATETEKLADRLGQLPRSARRQLGRALRDAARPDPKAKQLEDQTKRLRRRLRRLARDAERDPGDRRVARRLKRAKRQLERINQQRQARGRQQRRLQRLNQQLSAAASRLLQSSTPAARRALRDLARQLQQLSQDAESQRALSSARQQLTELKEMLRRLSRAKSTRLARLRRFQLRARGQGSPPDKRSGPRRDLFVLTPTPGSPQGRLAISKRDGASERRQSVLSPVVSERPGSATDPHLQQKRTRLRATTRDEALAGQHGPGPTRSDVIEAAAQREGFRTRGYRRVYKAYHDASLADIQREDVPPGRRHLVKRYFELIKPAED